MKKLTLSILFFLAIFMTAEQVKARLLIHDIVQYSMNIEEKQYDTKIDIQFNEPKNKFFITLPNQGLKNASYSLKDVNFMIKIDTQKDFTIVPFHLEEKISKLELQIVKERQASPIQFIKQSDLFSYFETQDQVDNYIQYKPAMSFGKQIHSSARIAHSEELFVLGSGKRIIKDKHLTFIELVDASEFSIVVADKDHYEIDRHLVQNTSFDYLMKKNTKLDIEFLKKQTTKYWKKYAQQFKIHMDYGVIVDFDMPIGGGPMGSYIVGIYAMDPLPQPYIDFLAQYFKIDKPFKNSYELVNILYSAHPDAWKAYMKDILAHELGHLLFGFGYTTETLAQYDHEAWFSLGIGLVYDRDFLARDDYDLNKYHMVASTIDNWKKLDKNPNVSPYLTGADTTNDQKHNVTRAQDFAHGKAYIYLKTVREKLGKDFFDTTIRNYLIYSSTMSVDGYLAFRRIVMHSNKEKFLELINLEKEFKVFSPELENQFHTKYLDENQVKPCKCCDPVTGKCRYKAEDEN